MKKLSNLFPGSLPFMARIIVLISLLCYASFFLYELGAIAYFLLPAVSLLTVVLLAYYWPQRMDFFRQAAILLPGEGSGKMPSFKARPITARSFASTPVQTAGAEESLTGIRNKMAEITGYGELSLALMDKEFREEKSTGLQRTLLFGLVVAYLRYVALSRGSGKVVIELVSFDYAVQVIITDCRRGIQITDTSDTNGIREMTSRITLHKGSFDIYSTKTGSRVLMAQV